MCFFNIVFEKLQFFGLYYICKFKMEFKTTNGMVLGSCVGHKGSKMFLNRLSMTVFDTLHFFYNFGPCGFCLSPFSRYLNYI